MRQHTTNQKAKKRREEVIRSETVLMAVGSWLFGRCLVYRISEPDRTLRQKTIHWDKGSCDLEDEDGQIYYNVPWDQIEFAPDNDIEFHFADE